LLLFARIFMQVLFVSPKNQKPPKLIYLFVRPEWVKTGDSDLRESKWKIRLWLCKSVNYTSELIVSNAQIVS